MGKTPSGRVFAYLVIAAALAAFPRLATAQTIAAATVSGIDVVIVGTSLGGTTTVTVGDVTVQGVVINGDGTLVTGTLPSALSAGTYALRVKIGRAHV